MGAAADISGTGSLTGTGTGIASVSPRNRTPFACGVVLTTGKVSSLTSRNPREARKFIFPRSESLLSSFIMP